MINLENAALKMMAEVDQAEVIDEESSNAPSLGDDHHNEKAVCLNISDFLSKQLPPREVMLSPWLTRQSLFMILCMARHRQKLAGFILGLCGGLWRYFPWMECAEEAARCLH